MAKPQGDCETAGAAGREVSILTALDSHPRRLTLFRCWRRQVYACTVPHPRPEASYRNEGTGWHRAFGPLDAAQHCRCTVCASTQAAGARPLPPSSFDGCSPCHATPCAPTSIHRRMAGKQAQALGRTRRQKKKWRGGHGAGANPGSRLGGQATGPARDGGGRVGEWHR